MKHYYCLFLERIAKETMITIFYIDQINYNVKRYDILTFSYINNCLTNMKLADTNYFTHSFE